MWDILSLLGVRSEELTGKATTALPPNWLASARGKFLDFTNYEKGFKYKKYTPSSYLGDWSIPSVTLVLGGEIKEPPQMHLVTTNRCTPIA
jgi:hypothetical protein